MTKKVAGLFCAGQVNGTTGYEEAAAQGILAGINAARLCQQQPLISLRREESYIGTLIDDLVTKEIREPYRVLTSRSEYRLLLRSDNADLRLTPLGREVGLIDDRRWGLFETKYQQLAQEVQRLEATRIGEQSVKGQQVTAQTGEKIRSAVSLADLLRRPGFHYPQLIELGLGEDLPRPVWEGAEIQIKYAGYIERQTEQVTRISKQGDQHLPEDLVYAQLAFLSKEAREKLAQIRPQNIGQASRIGGVSPADIHGLLIYLRTQTHSHPLTLTTDP